jgi:hypothetical protein
MSGARPEPERVRVDPAAEFRHRPGSEPGWREAWSFDAVARDATVGISVRLALHPQRRRAGYRALLFGEGRPLVAVIDDDVPLPGATAGLEIRTDGLWADHPCEAPLERWSLGLEAFALALDATTEVTGDDRGERIPFGLDLEWDADGVPEDTGPGRYAVPCRVHGGVLVGREALELDGWGRWSHRWGPPPPGPWTRARARVRGTHGTWASWPVGEPDTPRDGRPVSIPTAPRSLRAHPVAWAALRLPRPGGVLRWTRCLARFTDEAGPAGTGWLELCRHTGGTGSIG